MGTLYISDLDGTLLDRRGHLSATTRAGLQQLLDRGVAFTIATARSVVSVRERFDLPLSLPVVCANGTFVDDLDGATHLHIADMDRHAALEAWEEARRQGLDPLVTTTSEAHGDRMFFLQEHKAPTAAFLEDRRAYNDPRTRLVEPDEVRQALRSEKVTGLVAIDRAERLGPFTEQINASTPLSVHLNDDYYFRGYQWLTLHAPEATKGHGIGVLRDRFAPDTDRIVVFGDQTNDLPMFEIADHAVAVDNAHPSVKAIAHEIIGHHDDDAVVEWLLKHTA